MSKEKIVHKIQTYARSQYKKLNNDDFVLGENPHNYRCQLNAVQKVKECKAEKVFLCYAIQKDDSFSCVHFINQLVDGKYQDNTWGWLYQDYDYYLIREVDESEYDYINDILTDTKKALYDLYANWFDKYILRVKEDIL
jgi:hypothetical protein